MLSGGSNWLDRLWSSKGFPAGEESLDLDRFVFENPSSGSSLPIPISESNNRSENRRFRGEPELAARAVKTALSELFFVGGSAENAELSVKKFRRKQTNPRLCVASSSNNVGGNSHSSVRSGHQIREIKKQKMKKKGFDFAAKYPGTVNNSRSDRLARVNKRVDDVEDVEEEEGGEEEMRGYSRTEATVIDTSFADWKVERLVFRKRNVWKVLEKRGKPKSFGRKKRKHDDDEEGEPNPRGKALALEFDNGDRALKMPSCNEVCEKSNKSSLLVDRT